MAASIPLFAQGTIEGAAKAIGELYSGSELTRVLDEARLRGDPGEGHTKWRRLALVVANHQARYGTGKALVALIGVALSPERTFDRAELAAVTRDHLNQMLSLAGLKVLDDGRVARTAKARTVSEAQARTEHLRELLTQRGAHERVLAYCRPELLREDYYEAVFEAIKGLGSRLRDMGGTDADGPKLVESTLEGVDPLIRLNTRATQTQRDEQRGVALLMKGIFAAFRNPAAHEPRIEWSMSEQDALDVLGTLSMVHRRLDASLAAR